MRRTWLLFVAACGATPAEPPAVPIELAPSASEAHEQVPPPEVPDALRFDLTAPAPASEDELALWATYYYVPEVDHAPDGFELRDMDDGSLGVKLTRRNWCEAAMQGTVAISNEGDTVMYNYAGTRKNIEVDCKPIYPHHKAIGRTRFALARGKWGDGVEGRRLVPYRSIAVDPDTIPFGSVVYIPSARGTELPDNLGEHDGFFFAADRGGAIKRNHIDVFVGIGKRNPFTFVTNKRQPTFAAQLIDDPAVLQRFRREHTAP